MAKITYPATSAYAATKQKDWRMDRYVHRTLAPHSEDTAYTVEAKYNNRPDLLAYDLYGKASLFWVFTSRNINRMRDPIWDLTTGLEIMLPSRAALRGIGCL